MRRMKWIRSMALMQREAHRYTQAQMFHKTKYGYQVLTCHCECPLMHMSAQLYISMTVPMYHTCAHVRKRIYTQVSCQCICPFYLYACDYKRHYTCLACVHGLNTYLFHRCPTLPTLPLTALPHPKRMPIRIYMQLSVHADASCALADHVLPCFPCVPFPGNLEAC